jgi:hypothetical protein
MTVYKKIIIASLIFFTFIGNALAQETNSNGGSANINSPYSRYGFGQLTDQLSSRSISMGGLALGLRCHNEINFANPASYTAVDSLTFLFEGGVSIQNTNFNDGKVRINAKNSQLDYLAMQFRITNKLAATAGFLPFSTVGYNIRTTQQDIENNANTKYINSFNGEGGVSQVFVGVGYKFSKHLSVGANLSYLFGTIDHTSKLTFSDTNINSSIYSDQIKVHDYKLDLGLQYSMDFDKHNRATLGLTYSLGHELSSSSYITHQRVASTTYTTTQKSRNGFELPHMFGIGLAYQRDNKLTVGLDYIMQKWSNVKFLNKENQLSDRTRISLGAEYQPNALSRNYLARIKYRIGAYYSDSYANIDGQQIAKEYGVSAGFSFPVFGKRSVINISGQYVRVSPKALGTITENQLRINIGITFNERWFAKWKVQ